MLHVFIQPSSNFITGDVQYYLWWMQSGQPDSAVLREYPLPVVWFLRALHWSAGDSHFIPAFATTMLLLDALLAVAMWHDGHRAGALWWIVLVPFLGPIMWHRFDMVPAVCMGLAALWYRRHPAACGAMIALGAAVKLWPALLILPMISRRKAAMRRLTAFVATGFTLALASLLAGGWDRLVSPLTWQSDRGLQVESVLATVPVYQRFKNPDSGYRIEFSKYNAYEVFGPGASAWQLLSTVLMALAVTLAVGMAVISWRRNGLDHRSAVLADLVIIGALIIANKTLSPQYFVWWAAPAAMILDQVSGETTCENPPNPKTLSRARTWCGIVAGLLLVTALLTQLVYPLKYPGIIGAPPHRSSTLLLVVRNGMTIVTFAACVVAFVASLRMRRPAQPSSAPGRPVPTP
ncbi:glycosyltransferase family 87 protein [Cutibacterium equinum]|uniref:Glycosyltransferase family 87 protein n=1 Tax=Cutibacterium equinum TaxID=3016342 RepID=A0ABY7R1B6_9ACTN|nr:glycosyltransferase family 87 protein [Cutibacterium equinum]WCC81096.1 glycosyltransferase family 87 protein [Cutibacterium equinum]